MHNTDIEKKLRNRIEGLRGAPISLFHDKTQLFFAFFDNEPRLSSITEDLAKEFPGMKDRLSFYLSNTGAKVEAKSESEAAAYGDMFLRMIADKTDIPRAIYNEVYVREFGTNYTGPADQSDEKYLTSVKNRFLEPFASYILERIESGIETHSAHDYDPLVGLLRKEIFERDLPPAVERSSSSKRPLSLVVIDLDKFKPANDTYGHPAGDLVLKEFALILKANAFGRGNGYRTGGDEFAILLENHTSLEAALLSERVRSAVSAESFAGKGIKISTSIGVATIPEHADCAEELAKYADSAMYDAKNHHGNLVRIYGERDRPREEEAKHDTRRQPDPLGLSREDADKIRKDFVISGKALCPHDHAPLEVLQFHIDERRVPELDITCALCGFHSRIPSPA